MTDEAASYAGDSGRWSASSSAFRRSSAIVRFSRHEIRMLRLQPQLERPKLLACDAPAAGRQAAVRSSLIRCRPWRLAASERHHFRLGQKAFQHQTAVPILTGRLRERLNLQLQVLNHLHVGVEL